MDAVTALQSLAWLSSGLAPFIVAVVRTVRHGRKVK